jgi:ubiquinone/menaquinone biosynthesis C-methylase UbiE
MRLRQIPPWHSYERMAALGRYGDIVDEAGEPALSRDGEGEAAFFRSALAGRHRVLDLGCGPGFPLLFLHAHARTLYGLDASPAMLVLARRNRDALKLGEVVLIRGFAEALPFPASSFDGIAVCGTLGSVEDPSAIISEMVRVTSSGGVIASIEQDFRHRLAQGRPRTERRLCREADSLRMELVESLTEPYRIRRERYGIDPSSDLGRQMLADRELAHEGRRATDLSPHELPPQAILDASCEEEAQFDPDTLRRAVERAGLQMVSQHLAVSYGVPHIFSTLRRQ